MVVPESLISTTQNFYISDYLLKNCKIIAVIGMPEDLFKTSGKSLMIPSKRICDGTSPPITI